MSTWREILSGENKVLSSKRVMGTIVLAICMGCIIHLVVNEGGTQIVENLLQTAMVTAAGLLGISTVTSIWRGKNENNHIIEEEPEIIDPCADCPHNKKGTD